MIKGLNYAFTQIEIFANEKGYEINSLGANVIGESFLVLRKDDRDMTISFVLTGASSNNYIYECIYSDL